MCGVPNLAPCLADETSRRIICFVRWLVVGERGMILQFRVTPGNGRSVTIYRPSEIDVVRRLG